jgi:hypothetical protein
MACRLLRGKMGEDATEIVGQLRRSLVLLRGCDMPGARSQIEHLVASLGARLRQIAPAEPKMALGRSAVRALIPTAETAARMSPIDCRSYAIQCESMASLATDPKQQEMLRALARLWRALASG